MGDRGRWNSEFETSLVYRVSSRTARAIQRNPVSKNQKQKTTTKQNKTKQRSNMKTIKCLEVSIKTTLEGTDTGKQILNRAGVAQETIARLG